ncbi:MAG: M4 family metallopeptidase, partial [Francisellaceae bacterium]
MNLGGMFDHAQQHFWSTTGIPIWGNQIITHEFEAQTTVTGTIYKDIGKDITNTSPKISNSEAYLQAYTAFMKGHPGASVDNNSINKTLYVYIDADNHARLIYEVSFFALDENKPYHMAYLIDADDGSIIKSWNKIAFADYESSGVGGYSWPAYYSTSSQRDNSYSFVNSPTEAYQYGALLVTSDDGGTNCTMVSNVTNQNVSTYNFNNKTLSEIKSDTNIDGGVYLSDVTGSSPTVSPYPFQCNFTQDNSQDKITSPYNSAIAYSPAAETHYFTTETMKMFHDQYNYSDAFPNRLYIFTHINMANAYAIPGDYDASQPYPDQAWFGTPQSSDNSSQYLSLTSSDVVSHELGHIITGYNAALIYSDESGGINEAFSDITAIAFMSYLEGLFSWSTWTYLIGGQIYISSPYFLRSMSNPPADGNSIDNVDEYRSDMDVHYSSGIYNKAFYNLITDYGWSVQKAYSVFLEANIAYWTSSTTFDDGVCGLENATTALGYSSTDITQLDGAFADVGAYCNGNNSSSDDSGSSSAAVAVAAGVGAAAVAAVMIYLFA